jgi:hypothetical protein
MCNIKNDQFMGSLKGRHNSEDLDVDGMIILKLVLRKCVCVCVFVCVDWIDLAQDRDRQAAAS